MPDRFSRIHQTTVPVGLIDASGLKGTTVGGAMISEHHGNFLVNKGGATAEDVLQSHAIGAGESKASIVALIWNLKSILSEMTMSISKSNQKIFRLFFTRKKKNGVGYLKSECSCMPCLGKVASYPGGRASCSVPAVVFSQKESARIHNYNRPVNKRKLIFKGVGLATATLVAPDCICVWRQTITS